MLNRTRRCSMKLDEMFHQSKAGTEFAVERFRTVTNNVQAAALGRGFRAECRYDDMAPRFDGMCDLAHVRSAVLRLRQKVEHRPVMPNVVLVPGKGNRRDVTAEPVDHARRITKSFFRDWSV